MLEAGFINNCQEPQVDLSFINNTAQLAGSALHVGWIDLNMYYYNPILMKVKSHSFSLITVVMISQ